ncbi:hypothetical protein FIONNBHARTH_73 [Mycobacterium phage Fionnbharth]|uniref:HNH endonuclease n=2 Tax=Fionnbharthvirus TaxID=2948708 RepID=A0A6G6XSM5_9CAUD|nr:HNH endonuclease [Mycobacterium phage Fionnbharth]YP_009950415.1 HNH endonuclease [Mycobacterium phage Eponine]AER26364.1 hypothetical protein FIONNBHARTH_73 [Mycobacterium phage Fionnbharth]QIG61844.1 HNH endonuclease [Mycobacterium phage Eponine]
MARKSDMRLLALQEWIIETRAGGRCECDGLCGKRHRRYGIDDDPRCPNKHGYDAIDGRKVMVSLIVDRVDEMQGDTDVNLIALCQSCSRRHRDNLSKAAAERAEREAVEAQHDPLFDVDLFGAAAQ